MISASIIPTSFVFVCSSFSFWSSHSLTFGLWDWICFAQYILRYSVLVFFLVEKMMMMMMVMRELRILHFFFSLSPVRNGISNYCFFLQSCVREIEAESVKGGS